MKILKGYFEVIENILVEPISIAFVLGFNNPQFKFLKFKHDDMNAFMQLTTSNSRAVTAIPYGFLCSRSPTFYLMF